MPLSKADVFFALVLWQTKKAVVACFKLFWGATNVVQRTDFAAKGAAFKSQPIPLELGDWANATASPVCVEEG